MAVLGLLLLGSSVTFAQSNAPFAQKLTDNSNFGENQSYLAKLAVDTNGNFSRMLAGPVVGDEINGTVTSGSNDVSRSEVGVKSDDLSRTIPTTKSPTEVGTLNAHLAAGPPNVVLVNSVTHSEAPAPGTDLVYTIAFTNNGGQAAQAFIVVDPIPAQTDFKLNSANTVLGTTGMTVVVEYSADAAVTWTYIPVSGGGGATADYDRMVTHVRWTFTGGLSHSSPNNTGSVGLTAKIR